MRTSWIHRWLLAAGLIVVALAAAPAQAAPAPVTSVVTGIVTNADGAPIAGAIVSLRGERGAFSIATDSRGDYSIDVLPGTYTFEAIAKGYEPTNPRAIDVGLGTTAVVDAQLEAGSASLTTLGHVVTRAGEALSTTSAPSQQFDAQTYAARGGVDLTTLLADDADLAVVVRPAGGNPAAPTALALRGPDPTETLVDLDGHEINSGGSGAFDLSLIDPAQLSSVQVVDGVAPGSLAGPNTIDGTINVETLDPTAISHSLVRLSAGSFDAFGETAAATGTDGGVGYALSLHRQTTRGEPDEQIVTDAGSSVPVGSSVDGSTGLTKIRFGIDGGAGSVLVTASDQSAFHDLSAALSAIDTPQSPTPAAQHDDFSGSAQLTHGGDFGLDVELPLGRPDASGSAQTTLTLRHLTSLFDQSVVGPAAGTDPFLNDERDAIGDDILELDRSMPGGSLSLKLDVRTESLRTAVTPGAEQDQIVVGQSAVAVATPVPASPAVVLGQTQHSLGIRYAPATGSKIHAEAAAYLSDFSTFGSSFDPRVGVVWTPNAQTAIRTSFGTTFQSPQLLELYVPPTLPPPDPNGFFDIGNPDLTADRATDLDLGAEHIFAGASDARAGIDIFRTSLRNSSHKFLPSIDCNPSVGPPPPPALCESFPINVGDSVYEGFDGHVAWKMGDAMNARVSYAVDASAPTTVSPLFQDGTVVAGEQYLGVPLQTATVSIEHSAGPLSLDALLRYEGRYNELNRPPFAQLGAGATWRRGGLEVGLYGTNLTDVYDDHYTLLGQGVPYGGVAGPIPTDAYSLQGRAVTFVVTLFR